MAIATFNTLLLCENQILMSPVVQSGAPALTHLQ